MPNKVRQEHEAPGQNADDRNGFIGIIRCDLAGHFSDPGLDAVGGDENLHDANAPWQYTCWKDSIEHQRKTGGKRGWIKFRKRTFRVANTFEVFSANEKEFHERFLVASGNRGEA